MQTSTPLPLLRTYLSTARRKFYFVAINSLNIVSLACALIGFSIENIVVGAVSVAGLLIGCLAIVATTAVWRRDVADFRVHTQPAPSARVTAMLTAPPRMAASGYEILIRKDRPADALLTSMNVNRALLAGANAALEIDRRAFRADHAAPVAQVLLREFTKRRPVLFNGKKVRMASDPVLDHTGALASVHLQPTRYFDTLMTNDAVALRLTSHRTRREIMNGREFCFPDRMVPPCEQSACANQVGASTLAVTSDDYLVIVEQGPRANMASGMLASSGSGSADWDEIDGCHDLQHFVAGFAGRELAEECGLSASDIAWLKIIGYGRLLDRGGLPQFFCLAQLHCPLSEIHITRSERLLTDGHLPIDIRPKDRSYHAALQAAIRSVRKDRYRIFSSLWWNLELLSLVPEHDIEQAFG